MLLHCFLKTTLFSSKIKDYTEILSVSCTFWLHVSKNLLKEVDVRTAACVQGRRVRAACWSDSDCLIDGGQELAALITKKELIL